MTGHSTAITAIAAAMVSAALLGSCNSTGCTENRNAIPQAEFFSAGNEDAISLDSLEIVGVNAPRDSVLSAPGTQVSKIYLPMRPTADVTAWSFAYRWKALDDPRLNDTITFAYTTIPYFTSEECGATYRYHIDRMDYTRRLIDSVAVVDSMITNVDKVYIRIFFKVSDADE